MNVSHTLGTLAPTNRKLIVVFYRLGNVLAICWLHFSLFDLQRHAGESMDDNI